MKAYCKQINSDLFIIYSILLNYSYRTINCSSNCRLFSSFFKQTQQNRWLPLVSSSQTVCHSGTPEEKYKFQQQHNDINAALITSNTGVSAVVCLWGVSFHGEARVTKNRRTWVLSLPCQVKRSLMKGVFEIYIVICAGYESTLILNINILKKYYFSWDSAPIWDLRPFLFFCFSYNRMIFFRTVTVTVNVVLITGMLGEITSQ